MDSSSPAGAYAVIRNAAAGLQGRNAATSIDCPFCLGGRNRDKKTLGIGLLALGGVWYACKRVKCGRKGRVDSPTTSYVSREARPFVPRIYSGEIEELPDDIRERYSKKYGIPSTVLSTNVGWDAARERTVWKVVGPTGAVRGYEFRDDFRHPGSYRTKSLPYRHSSGPWIGYYAYEGTDFGTDEHPGIRQAGGKGEDLIVVEDSISALKVSKYFWSASLMGTSLSMDKAIELSKLSDRVILALDLDATDKARGILYRNGFLLSGARLLPLRKDMKYWSYEEIRELKYGA